MKKQKKRLSLKQLAKDLKSGKIKFPDTKESSNHNLWLGYQNGMCKISWSADYMSPYDVIALYDRCDTDDLKMLKWVYADQTNPWVTTYEIRQGYQARYLVWDYSLNKYVSRVRTDIFPNIRRCSV